MAELVYAVAEPQTCYAWGPQEAPKDVESRYAGSTPAGSNFSSGSPMEEATGLSPVKWRFKSAPEYISTGGQMAKAPGLGPGNCGFDSHPVYFFGRAAKMVVSRRTVNPVPQGKH